MCPPVTLARLSERRPRLSDIRFGGGATLVSAAEQAVPFGGLGDLEEPLEAGDGKLMQLAGAFGRTVGDLLGESRFEVREMLYVAQRYLAVVALGVEGGDEAFPGLFELPEPAVRDANRDLHICLVQPFGRAVLH